jgi:hypothetical protein
MGESNILTLQPADKNRRRPENDEDENGTKILKYKTLSRV